MKNIPFFRLLGFACILSLATSCETEQVEPSSQDCENGWGKLRLENQSQHTVQQIMVGGTNYGTLDPGEFQIYDLPVGDYTLTMNGISGGGGCGSPSDIHIPDCGMVARNCSY